MTTFGEEVVRFHLNLKPDWSIPKEYDLLYPFDQQATRDSFQAFYETYYSDRKSRYFIFGINPGRFGAGVTGVPFTDPIRLESVAGIKNSFPKKTELSSQFIFQVIAAVGGLHAFTQGYYITSLCPFGFVKNGKNFNYYDDRKLQEAVREHIIENIRSQVSFGARRDKAFSLGMGKNVQFFEQLNQEYQWFSEIVPLPHPRWVMQYRRRHLEEYVALYQEAWPV